MSNKNESIVRDFVICNLETGVEPQTFGSSWFSELVSFIY